MGRRKGYKKEYYHKNKKKILKKTKEYQKRFTCKYCGRKTGSRQKICWHCQGKGTSLSRRDHQRKHKKQ